jgi:ubiquinone/menaquinone biosynthesis C-methylase UbiE
MSNKQLVDARHASLREAFDRHALTYDERFSSLESTRTIRQEIWRIADGLFPPGSTLLDLGCGTGDDAIHFAQRGIAVTAIDIAPAMIARLETKATAAGIRERIEARVTDIETFEPRAAAFDGVLSDFGALNGVHNLIALRNLATRALKHGGSLVLVVMGRLYPLETAVSLFKGDFRRAFRRLQGTPEVALEGIRVSFRYHSPRDLSGALSPDFSLERLLGLRSVLPSVEWDHVNRFLPLGLVGAADRFATRFRLTAPLADLYLSIWRYR